MKIHFRGASQKKSRHKGGRGAPKRAGKGRRIPRYVKRANAAETRTNA